MLLRHTGILCHKDAGAEGIPGIIPGMPVLLRCSGILILGLPVLLQHTGILCHKDAGGEGSPGIILGLPVLLRHTGILYHRGAGWGCWGGR